MKLENIVSTTFLIALLTVVLFVGVWQIKPAQAVPIFSDGFESGNTSAWSSDDGSPTVVTSPINTGTYSMKNDADEGVNKTLTSATLMYMRVYIRIPTVPTNDYTSIDACSFDYLGAHGYALRASIYVDETTHLANWTIINDYASAKNSSSLQPSINTWYYVELKYSKGSTGIMYVNGNVVAELACQDINIDEANGGNVWGSAGLTSYIDDCVIDSSYIGPIAAGTNWWQYTFSFKDLNGNSAVGVTWGLYNSTTLLTYTQGGYNLLDGTYTLKSYFRGNLVNTTDLATASYGNSTITITLSIQSYGTTGTASIFNYSYSITAASGSIADLQAAINTVHAQGNGTVYIPAGTWNYDTFDVIPDSIDPTAVVSYGGINIIGQGTGSTVFKETHDVVKNKASMLNVDGRNGFPFRISGITFQGYVYNENIENYGLQLWGATDYRVDNCWFDNFSDAGIGCGRGSPGANRGLVDHCNFTNSYKGLNVPSKIWGYGINIGDRDSGAWSSESTLVGKFDSGSIDIVYVENCWFNASRHCITNNQNGYYVFRFNTITYAFAGAIDVHGFNWGRGGEIYNNTVTYHASSPAAAMWIRGGTTTIFNNTLINFPIGVNLINETQSNPYSNINHTYVWNNVPTGGGSEMQLSHAEGNTDPIENISWFHYARPAYTPYTYPHPYTVGTTGSVLGYIGFNGTATCTFNKVSDANLTFTATGTGNFQIIVDVTQNASQVLKTGSPITTWSYNATSGYILINTTSLSVWELDFGSTSIPLLSVALTTPNGNSQVKGNINFRYVPLLTGDSFYNASVWSNATGSWTLTQSNTTALVNNTVNTISYTINTVMTLTWNVKVWNSTVGVFAEANYTLYLTNEPYPNYMVDESENVYATAGNSQSKIVANSTGGLWCTYFKYYYGKWQIYVATSDDDGQTWSEIKISTLVNMSEYDQLAPCITIDSNDCLHVVWDGRTDTYSYAQIWYANYTTSWSTPLRISTSAGMDGIAQSPPAITVDSNDYLHVVWFGGATSYTKSQIWYANYTTDWSAPLRLSTVAGMDDSVMKYPCIVVDTSNYLHVIFRGNATGYSYSQIWYTKYTTSWSTPIVISTYTGMDALDQISPALAIASNDFLYAGWHGKATGFTSNQIWIAKYDGTWQTPVRISTYTDMDSYSQEDPTIAVDINNNIHVLWMGKATAFTDYNKVWYAKYDHLWSTPQCLQSTGQNQFPNIRWSNYPSFNKPTTRLDYIYTSGTVSPYDIMYGSITINLSFSTDTYAWGGYWGRWWGYP